MNDGEPPDETGESGHGPPEDGEAASEEDDADANAGTTDDVDAEAAVAETDGRDDDAEAGTPADGSDAGAETPADDAAGGAEDEADEEPVVDPGEEVEAAVREVMGPDVLGDGLDGDVEVSDGTADEAETDESETDEARDPAADAPAEPADPGGNGDGSAAVAEAAEATATADATGEAGAAAGEAGEAAGEPREDVPPDVRKYDRFKKIDGGTYDRANDFLRDRTYITAREWAMARLCADFRTETGVEMTKIGENLPELVPFMTDTYTPQAVNQARSAFEEKVRKAGATFLYGAMCDFFTAEELDDVMYEATEVAKFLLEVEGVELSVEEELAAEDHISEVMREVREHSAALRHDEVTCPECGHHIETHD